MTTNVPRPSWPQNALEAASVPPDPTVCSYLRGAVRVVEATEGRITTEGRRIVKATHIVIDPTAIAAGRVSHQYARDLLESLRHAVAFSERHQ